MTIDSDQKMRRGYHNLGPVPLLIYTKAPVTSRISYFLKLWSPKILERVGFAVIKTFKTAPKGIRRI